MVPEQPFTSPPPPPPGDMVVVQERLQQLIGHLTVESIIQQVTIVSLRARIAELEKPLE
jgi:hypothetical protein